jgi:predicted nucleic acid-binding protein
VDTGAFYALADRRDPAHQRARLFYEDSDALFLTSDFVFAETMSLLTKRLGKRLAINYGQGIRTSSSFRIEEPTPQMRENAWKLFAGHQDKEYDLIDCLSFSMMESFHICEAFGFDRHFVQYGFRLLPG